MFMYLLFEYNVMFFKQSFQMLIFCDAHNDVIVMILTHADAA